MAIMGKLSMLPKVGIVALVAVLAAGMFFAGYHVGEDAGFGEGREAGYISGLNEGYGLGLNQGYELGYEAGYWEVDGDIDFLVYRMGFAKAIHEYWLKRPPNPVTGSLKWHQDWVDTYGETIAVLEQIEGALK